MHGPWVLAALKVVGAGLQKCFKACSLGNTSHSGCCESRPGLRPPKCKPRRGEDPAFRLPRTIRHAHVHPAEQVGNPNVYQTGPAFRNLSITAEYSACSVVELLVNSTLQGKLHLPYEGIVAVAGQVLVTVAHAVFNDNLRNTLHLTTSATRSARLRHMVVSQNTGTPI